MKKPRKRKPAIPLSQAKKIAAKFIEAETGRLLPVVKAWASQIDDKWVVDLDTARGEAERFDSSLDFTITVLVDQNSGECEIMESL